jgi:hypothetical protein
MGCSRQESAFEDTSLSERGVIRPKGSQSNFPEPDLKGKALIAARQPDANDSVLYHSLLGLANDGTTYHQGEFLKGCGVFETYTFLALVGASEGTSTRTRFTAN